MDRICGSVRELAMKIPHQTRGLGFAACAAAGALWGCSFLAGKIALLETDFAHMILYRFLFAVLALAPFLVTNRPGLNIREWWILIVASFLGVPMQFLIQFYGLSLTTVSHASLMVGAMPVILAVGAALYAHERLDALGWTAVVVSTCGAALIALSGSHHPARGAGTLAGDLLVVLSMGMALFWILLNKQLLVRHSVIVITSYGVLLGTIMLMVWVPLRYGMPAVRGISRTAWCAIAISGLLCTVAPKLLWNWGVARVPASQAGVLLNMQPLVGCLLGIAVLKERLGLLAWVGGGLILAATLALTTKSKALVREPLPEV
jgi:drug/metabolite transporter (DMT)-like permease